MHRHDISNSAWKKIKPRTSGENGTRGGNAKKGIANFVYIASIFTKRKIEEVAIC